MLIKSQWCFKNLFTEIKLNPSSCQPSSGQRWLRGQPRPCHNSNRSVLEMGMVGHLFSFLTHIQTAKHTTCNESFQSKHYEELKPLNKEACEQFNSLLRSIQTSLTYISFEHYMTAMKVFVAFHNLK